MSVVMPLAQAQSGAGMRGAAPAVLAGMAVNPHVWSEEIRYAGEPPKEAGALVTLVWRSPSAEQGGALPDLFNGREPAQWTLPGVWSWADSARFVPAGGIALTTFNSNGKPFAAGDEVEAGWSRTGASVRVRLEEPSTVLAKVAFPGKRLVFHVENRGGAERRMSGVRVWVAGARGAFTEGSYFRDVRWFRGDATLAAHSAGGGVVEAVELPRKRVVLEVCFAEGPSAWGVVKVKDDRFDIGAGWLNTKAPNGVNPLTLESFRKTLQRLWINTARINYDVAGVNPLRLIGGRDLAKEYDTAEWRDRVHTIEAAGEVQMDATPPMELLKRFRMYESTPFPTSITFSEDWGFRYYAGLCDYPHFDAYRVNAPSADRWERYERWGGERIRWGAPLEGVGAMTRTLAAVNRPRPVAAWSQSVHYNWTSHLGGRERLQPTADEIRVQAYEALANGIQSLYWYSLESWSLAGWRDTLAATARIGREIRLLGEFYEQGRATSHRRENGFDLNVVAAPEGAVLFAIDLDYGPSADKTFAWKQKRRLDARYELPEWLGDVKDCYRVAEEGIQAADWERAAGGLRLRGVVDKVGIWVAARDAKLGERLAGRYRQLLAEEAATGFDPAGNDADFEKLKADLGYRGR